MKPMSNITSKRKKSDQVADKEPGSGSRSSLPREARREFLKD